MIIGAVSRIVKVYFGEYKLEVVQVAKNNNNNPTAKMVPEQYDQ